LNLRFHIVLIVVILGLVYSTHVTAQLPSACPGSSVRYGTQGLPNSTFIWTVTGGQILTNYNDSVDIRWDNAAGTGTLTVQEITEFSCTGPITSMDVSLDGAVVDLGPDQAICANDQATFSPSGSFVSFQWQNGSTDDSYTTNLPGLIWLEATDALGCTGRDTVNLVVNSLPTIELGNDFMLCDMETKMLDGGDPSRTYFWTIDADGSISTSTNSQINVGQGIKTISIMVTDDNGCVAYDTTHVLECIPSVGKIYNTITPNGDNIDDKWEIEYIQYYPNAKIEVFDRWGRLVFKTDHGYNNDWDGTSLKGKPLPMDSYMYIIDLKNGSKPMVGTITIIR
jgi:gliding motility-associated-like protein